MQNIQIQNLTAEELKELISEAVRSEFQNSLKQSKEETTEFLTRQQVADLLQVTTVTLWNWEKEDIIIPHRFGNQVRYKRSEIENSLQDLKEKKNKRRKK